MRGSEIRQISKLQSSRSSSPTILPQYVQGKHRQPEIKKLLLDPSSSLVLPFLLNTVLNHENLSLPSSALLRSPGIIPLHSPASVRLPRQRCIRLVGRYRSRCCLPIGTMADRDQPRQRSR